MSVIKTDFKAKHDGKSRFHGLAGSETAKFNRVCNWPNNGAKLTGMDIVEFTYTPWPTSTLFCKNKITYQELQLNIDLESGFIL